MPVSKFSTDNFKAALIGGGARPNQFVVTLTFPPFAQDGNAANTAQFLVTAASLPGQRIGTTNNTIYRGRQIKVAGDRVFEDWRITVINDASMSIRRALERWMNGINGLLDNTGRLNPFDYQANLTVTQLDRNNQELKTYIMRDCMPIDLSEIQLDFSSNDTVEEYQVTFAVQDFITDFNPAGLAG